MNRILLSFCALIVVNLAHAQGNQVNLSNNQLETFLFNRDSEEIDAAGSPYIQEEFVMAEVSGYTKAYEVRYNAYKDVLEFKNDEGTILEMNYINDLTIKLLDGSGIIYETVAYETGNTGIAQLLWQDDEGHKLYKKRKINFFPAEDTVAGGYGVPKNARFEEDAEEYFVVLEPNTALKTLPSKKRDFFDMFDKMDLKSYAKDERLKNKREEDLILLLDHYFKSI